MPDNFIFGWPQAFVVVAVLLINKAYDFFVRKLDVEMLEQIKTTVDATKILVNKRFAVQLQLSLKALRQVHAMKPTSESLAAVLEAEAALKEHEAQQDILDARN